MFKIKYSILLVLLFGLGHCDYFYIYKPSDCLAYSQINNKEYLARPAGIFQKISDYYEQVYAFPKPVQKAVFEKSALLTPEWKYTFTNKIIKPEQSINKLSEINIIPANILVREKILNYYVRQDFLRNGKDLLVFRSGNQMYIGELENNLVIKTLSSHTWFKDVNNDNLPELIVDINNNNFIYKKQNGAWIIDATPAIQPLNKEQLKNMSADELAYLRYEIAARRGKIFKNPELQKQFAAKKWYNPDPRFSEKVFTRIERDNIKLLYTLEGQKRRSALKDKPELILPNAK